jgi:Tfp pilus assembly protein PilF
MLLSVNDTTLRPRDARALIGLGRCRLAAGDVAGAEQRFRDALDIERRYRRGGHPDVARAEIALAEALMAAGNNRDTGPLLQGAVDSLAPLVLPGQIDLVAARRMLRDSPADEK